jgi:hypothetical protein
LIVAHHDDPTGHGTGALDSMTSDPGQDLVSGSGPEQL